MKISLGNLLITHVLYPSFYLSMQIVHFVFFSPFFYFSLAGWYADRFLDRILRNVGTNLTNCSQPFHLEFHMLVYPSLGVYINWRSISWLCDFLGRFFADTNFLIIKNFLFHFFWIFSEIDDSKSWLINYGCLLMLYFSLFIYFFSLIFLEVKVC